MTEIISFWEEGPGHFKKPFNLNFVRIFRIGLGLFLKEIVRIGRRPYNYPGSSSKQAVKQTKAKGS
jgi:hypothetical protein